MYIMLNVNMDKFKKNKKKLDDLLPLGSLFLMGLNSALSTYSQVFLRKGGGELGLPVNRSVLTYLDLWGHLTLGQIWAFQFCFFYEFTHVPSSLPAFQAVVIQQLSIG